MSNQALQLTAGSAFFVNSLCKWRVLVCRAFFGKPTERKKIILFPKVGSFFQTCFNFCPRFEMVSFHSITCSALPLCQGMNEESDFTLTLILSFDLKNPRKVSSPPPKISAPKVKFNPSASRQENSG